ncbi:MAG: (2Fe-2S)-binding protein [Pirellulales bacterium]|nr:(2Fe-2S)-binding protein [Pirellulales bacterium]
MKDDIRRDARRTGFNRRDFLKGSGAAAAATALSQSSGLLEASPESGSRVIGPGVMEMTLNVNGQDHDVQAETRTTLLEVLRNQLKLTGAKPVATDASVGGSTIWIDGRLASAGSTLAVECGGKKIRTVESLGGDSPDAVPQAFVNNDAQQCGFCTPGFVVAVRAFLDKNPNATEDQIRRGLNGNLCRCGTYANVIEAALEVVKGGPRG